MDQMFESLNKEEILTNVTNLFMVYGLKLLTAAVVLLVGWWLIGKFGDLLERILHKAHAEKTLVTFLHNLTSIFLKIILLVIAASMIGVETASLIAMLGAAGLAVGLALQGSLANFAGGVLILFFKPFKVGDEIEAEGYRGVVHEIQIFNTILKNRENEKIVIPNGLLSNGCIKNVFCEPHRRVDMTFGISYEDDLLKAKKVIADVLAQDEKVLTDPPPDIYISAHADSSINILVRPWCKSEHFWAVNFGTHENVKLAFDREGITIPFPQRDVHIKNSA